MPFNFTLWKLVFSSQKWIRCSKREPFHVLLPLLGLDAKCRLTMPVVRGLVAVFLTRHQLIKKRTQKFLFKSTGYVFCSAAQILCYFNWAGMVTNVWLEQYMRQNDHHFPDDIFKCISENENVWILIKISLKFVPNGPSSNIPALVQIMAWCRPCRRQAIIWTSDG